MNNVKCVILAGGLGTRLSEETMIKPKPMVEVGGKPILWHIMKTYSHYGINQFIICLGYKGYMIKEYFANYFLHMSDITFDIKNNQMRVHNQYAEPWQVTLVDTGDNTMTGGRILKVKDYIQDEPFFCLTYGDGLSNVNIAQLIKFHQQQQKIATLTAVVPVARFGVLDIKDNNLISDFREKPQDQSAKINGGFFVLSPKILEFITDANCIWEQEPLKNLAHSQQLNAYHHHGFWQAMDTLRDKNYLEDLWLTNKAPWKVWL